MTSTKKGLEAARRADQRKDHKQMLRDQGHLQDLLDEALRGTVPASDPIQLSLEED